LEVHPADREEKDGGSKVCIQQRDTKKKREEKRRMEYWGQIAVVDGWLMAGT
jgi:hypothetical protein